MVKASALWLSMGAFVAATVQDDETSSLLSVKVHKHKSNIKAKQPEDLGCPEGVGETAEVDGKCYFVQKKPQYTLDEGRAWCQDHGGELASINSEKGNQAIISILGKRSAWIGALRVGSTNEKELGSWIWEDGSPWFEPEAHDSLSHNGGNLYETRIALHHGVWHDWREGEHKKSVVCQTHCSGPRHEKNPFFANLCIEPRDEKPATLTLPEDTCVSSVEIFHKVGSGKISCRKAETGDSNFGCDQGGNSKLGLVIADDRVVTAPVFTATEGLRPTFHKHAHWYKLPGIHGESKSMAWKFDQPYLMPAKEYQLWYNEDLSGGTEGDNRGRACYDVMLHKSAQECKALAPLQFGDVCVSAAGGEAGAHGSIALPQGTCVTGIDIMRTWGKVSCYGAADENMGGMSYFGCGAHLIGLVWTNKDQSDVVMPKQDQVIGMQRTEHKHAHWYTMSSGVSKNKLSMTMKQGAVRVDSGGLDLWYNEDLTGGTESDNHGRACYEVAVHRSLDC